MKNESAAARMRRYLQLVATGPELSKSLSREQAADGVSMILAGDVDPVQAGIFFIALRMKRETDAENIGAFDALQGLVRQCVAATPRVLALADPFNGYLRGMPATPFLPAVLAACGVPTYMHGMLRVGPKYGITANQVLAAAGKRVDLTAEQAAACLDDAELGWCYIDQAAYLPQLHALVGLRDTMVKRSCLSTLEVVLKPVCGRQETGLMTGFVHKAYPPVYAALARHAGFDSAIIVRGVEGGCIPALNQVSRYFGFDRAREAAMYRLSPADCGITQTQRAASLPQQYRHLVEQVSYQQPDALQPIVQELVDQGLDALADRPGCLRDSLIYGGAIALAHFNRSDIKTAVQQVRAALATGAASKRFEAGL